MPTTPPEAPPTDPGTRRPDAIAKLDVPGVPKAGAYAAVVLLVTLGLCASAVTLNVTVNPRAEFSFDHYRPLVVDRVHDAVQAYEDHDGPVEDLVLGTSRAGFVRGMPGREDVTFNFFIAGSPPQDWRDVYSYFKQQQGPPENLVLVVDQSSFSDVFAPRVPTSASAGVVLGDPPSLEERAALALRTLSVPYVRDTLRSLELRFVTGYPPPPSPDPFPGFARPDLMEAYREGTFDPAAINPVIDQQFQRAFGPSHSIVPANAQALRDLLDQALADGVSVWAILPPYQPVALADLEARFPSFAVQVQQVRDVLASYCPSIRVTDATHAEAARVDPREFFDQSHLTPTGSDMLIQGAAEGLGDACPEAPGS